MTTINATIIRDALLLSIDDDDYFDPIRSNGGEIASLCTCDFCGAAR